MLELETCVRLPRNWVMETLCLLSQYLLRAYRRQHLASESNYPSGMRFPGWGGLRELRRAENKNKNKNLSETSIVTASLREQSRPTVRGGPARPRSGIRAGFPRRGFEDSQVSSLCSQGAPVSLATPHPHPAPPAPWRWAS